MLTWKSKSSSFEETAMPHIGAVFRFALHLCGNEADAEDLAQECYYLAYRKYHQFRRDSNCRAWLFRIARNSHIDRVRRRVRQPRAMNLRDLPTRLEPVSREESTNPLQDPAFWDAKTWDPENRSELDPSPDANAPVENEEALYDMFGDEVNRILAELSPEFRLAVILCDVEGFTYQEIGDVLDCAVGTVRSRLARARCHLRERLLEYARDLGYLKSRKV